jgi:hypothetical protein
VFQALSSLKIHFAATTTSSPKLGLPLTIFLLRQE